MNFRLQIIHNAFSTQFSDLCVQVLISSGEIKWEYQANSEMAPRSGTLVLDNYDKNNSLRFALIAKSLSEKVSEHLSSIDVAKQQEDYTYAIQCFATLMKGDPACPPFILPHSDNNIDSQGNLVNPEVTVVYYPLVVNCEGGELCIHGNGENENSISISHAPKCGDLVIFPGNVVHSVMPLLKGERLSIVLNVYKNELVCVE